MKLCANCNNEFVDVSPQRQMKYCSKECRHQKIYKRDYRGPFKGRTANCNVCNKEFIDKTRSGITKYCSDECRHKFSSTKDYNLTPEEHQKMKEEQNNRCVICEKLPSVKPNLSIDHCHKSGKVRGLLCHHCNSALGYFRDDPEIIKSAIKYLEKNR